MKGKDDLDVITRRLDVIIRILLESFTIQHEELNTGDKLIFLEKTGVASTDAARILGIDPNQLTSYRRRAKIMKPGRNA